MLRSEEFRDYLRSIDHTVGRVEKEKKEERENKDQKERKIKRNSGRTERGREEKGIRSAEIVRTRSPRDACTPISTRARPSRSIAASCFHEKSGDRDDVVVGDVAASRRSRGVVTVEA